MFTSLTDLDANRKQELVASLSALLVGKAAGDEDVTGEKIEAVATASGNKVSAAYASLWASVVSAGGIETFTAGPGSGGGGGGGGGGAAAEEVEEEKDEEEEADIGGGMDMFGGDEGGGGDY